MAVGAIPSIQPPTNAPGRAVHVGRPLHFLLAAYGAGGGARGHRASATPFISSGGTLTLTFPGTAAFSSSLLACRRFAGPSRTAGLDGLLFAGRRPTLPPTSFFFPSWWRPGRPLPLPGRDVQSRSFRGAAAAAAAAGGSSVTLTMSGSVDGAAGVNGGEASSPRETTAGGLASSDAGGKSVGGEAGDGGDNFPIVTLDADAVQKFAEIEVRWGGDTASEPTVLIRGLKSAEYHVEAAEPTMARLRDSGHEATITGGGRIKHSSKRRSIFVYGYSMQFGPANLPRVAELCRKQFGPDYEVTWTEGGY